MKSIVREVFSRFDMGYDSYDISRSMGIPHNVIMKILKGELKNNYQIYIYMHPSEAWD